MESILKILYTELERKKSPDYPGRKKDLEEYLDMCNIITEQQGPNFVDRFMELHDKIDGHHWMDEFSMGFRACARLMLELLGNCV